jgi:vitamin B12 transporter
MDDYETGDGGTFHNTGFDEQISASANLGFEFLPNNRIGVILNTFEVDHSGSPEYLNKNDRDDYSDKENRSVDFSYEGATSDNLYSWQARYFLGKDVDTWHDPTGSNPSGYDNGIPSERETDQEGAQAQITANHGIFRLTAGLDWAKYDVETTWNPQKTAYDSLAGYFLGRAKVFHDRLILTGGLRYDTYELDVLDDAGAKQDSDDVNFTAGAAFLLNDFVKFRINYGEAFIIPSADQLAADYVSSGTQYLGNPDLDPEKSRTYEAGVDFTYAASSASITYFHTDYKDKIESATSGSVKTWENIGEATISGFEGSFSTDLGAIFAWNFEVRPYFNIAYLTEFESEDTGEDLHDVCEINASYGLSVSDYDRFSAKLNFAYTGEQTITDYSAGYPYPVVKKAGFTVANLTVTQKIYEKAGFGALYLRGEINNLFDRDYEYVAGYPMPGRSFFLGLKYVL